MTRLSHQLVETLRQQMAGRRVPVPDGGQLVWRWFIDLCRTRSYHGYGPNPLTYSEIEAYARLYGWPLEGRHVDMILELDRAWMARARADIGGGKPTGPSQPMTADAFDAVFA